MNRTQTLAEDPAEARKAPTALSNAIHNTLYCPNYRVMTSRTQVAKNTTQSAAICFVVLIEFVEIHNIYCVTDSTHGLLSFLYMVLSSIVKQQ
jgi:hypothetical protein